MAGATHSQWASSQKKKLLINDIISEDHQISEEFFNILGWPAFQGLPGLACAINSNLIKICRLEQFQLKAWVFRAPTRHFSHRLLVSDMDCISYFQLTTVIQVPFRSGGGRERIREREREGEQRERNREHVSNRQQSPNAFQSTR